jgi:hypothetical protein
MPAPLAARRLEVFSAARADPAGFLRFDKERLRFSLGTSLADLAVPVLVTDDARAIVGGAAVEVALLLSSHHRAFVRADDLDRLILREDYAALPPVSGGLGAAGGGPDLRAAAQLAPAVHPALTGGLVTAWMGKGGRGRSLVGLWIELLRHAFEELEESRGREETPLVAALALGLETARAEPALRAALPSPPLDRYLRGAALCALWLAFRTGLARAWRDTGRPFDDPLLARLEACLSPAALVGGRAAILSAGVTLFGCELAAGLPRADEFFGRLAAGGDADAVRADLAALLAADDELSRRAEHAVAVARCRELLLGAVASAEAAGQEGGLEPLRATLAGPGALAAATADDAARKGLAAAALAASSGGEAGALLERAARFLRAWKQKDPAHAWGLSREAARAEYAAAATALLADLALDRFGAAARRVLSFRTGREEEGGAESEWEAGRLYRLSARGGPILRAAVDRPTGHLFADVKDFTRRTALLGNAAVAELLRTEFYLPILVAAKEHFSGMQHLADRGGVTLNNLLGDAVSFTGRIDAMVALAKAIRARLAAYAARLGRELGTEVVARRIAELEQAHAAPLARARTARAEAEAAARSLAATAPERPAAIARLARARAEEARLAEERDRALSRARGEVLEAGTFISFGPAPLTVVIEDEVFGRNRVAIAEKINESARGTARAPAARARADAALAQERARAGNPALAHAWSVFVGPALALPVPPEAEDQALRLWRAGDGAGAMKALSAPVRDALESAAREDDRPGDVYNSGAALSEEALEAFLAEVEGAREIRRVVVEPGDVPEGLRARWFYGDDAQDLVACWQGGRVTELFRRVGPASFKGLGRVVVWELCADEGAPAALAAALVGQWLRRG